MTQSQAKAPLSTLDLFGSFREPQRGPAKKRTKPSQAAPTEPVVDESLRAYAMRSAPAPAPQPSALPLGVEALPKVTDAARVQANDLARQIVAEGGELTPQALTALRQWSGEGAIGNSTSAYYTPHALATFMWDVAQAAGDVTRTLEPSCGGGVFLATAPRGTLLTAVELDETTAKVTQALHPHVTVHQAPFEQYNTQSEDAPFDLLIGNPPYGPRGASARLDRPDLDQATWYFLLEGLRRVRGGGLALMLVPENMIRNVSETAMREALLDEAHLLSVNVIPEGAFRAAGAGVTTALLVLRRHDNGVHEALAALSEEERRTLRDARTAQDPALTRFLRGNLLFDQDAQGNWTLQYAFQPLGPRHKNAQVRAGRYGHPSYPGDVILDEDTLNSVNAQVKARVNSILTRPGLEAAIHTLLGQEALERATATRLQAIPVREGQVSRCGTYRFRAGRWGYNGALNDPAVLSALNVAQRVVQARTNPSMKARAQQAHDEHVRRFGAYDLVSLERATKQLPILKVLTMSGGDVPALLADVKPPEVAIQGESMADIAQQLEAYGLLNVMSLCSYARVTPAAAQAHLLAEYAFNGRTWEARSTYYRGNAWEKARIAEQLAEEATGLEQAALREQAERLRTLAPWRDVTEMTLEPRDPLIPVQVLTDWVNAYLGTCVHVKRNAWDKAGEAHNLILAIRGEHGVRLTLRNTFDTDMNLKERRAITPERVRALEAYLNFRTPVDAVVNQDVKTPDQIAAERSANQQKAIREEHAIAAHFRQFVLTGPHAHAAELALNEGRYGLVQAVPDMRSLTLPAYRGPLAHPFQAAHVRTAAQMDGVILDFAVGLGKTLTGLMLAALLKQSGRCRLPAFVVPLSRLGDWVMNAAQALPDFNLLVIGGDVQQAPDGTVHLNEDGEPTVREDTGVKRRAKVASLLTAQPDLVIFTAEAFEAVPMLEETRMHFIERDATLMAGLGLNTTFDERHRKLGGHRELVTRERFIQRHSLRVRMAQESDVPFEATGIDAIITDEVHLFKSIYAAPTVYGEANPKFLGAGGESNRALDALHKFKYVRAQGGCTVGLSATWFTNSPLEIYAMLALHTDALPKYGVTDVQSFTARFCVIEPRLITLPDGGVEFRPCVVGFRNLDELRSIIAQHTIRETEETCAMHTGTGMPLPPLETVEHTFDLAPEVQALYDAEQASVVHAEAEGEMHLFSIFARMLKLTLHPPLMGVQAPNARFAACVDACLKAREQGGRNVVFMYTGGQGGETYSALKDMLIAAGYPEREIMIITASTHPTGGERLNVERRFRREELTCVIGSSVIEQGGNYQGATDLHHLDYPHHHMAFVQRIGRGRRQGSTVARIRNHLYFARGSFDVLRYQGMLGKKGWASQVYDPSIITCENAAVGFDGEEIAVMLSRDPDATRAAIRAKREARAQATRGATLRADMEVVREYLSTLSLLRQRHATAQGRENGPSRLDEAGIARLVTQLRALHAQVERLRSAGHPLAAVTRLTVPVTWLSGLPLHEGMTFDAGGRALEVSRVQEAARTVRAREVASGNMVDLAEAELEHVANVLPTREETAFGAEALEGLSVHLREQILAAAVPEMVPAPIPAVQEQPAPVVQALEEQPTPITPARVQFRYGLRVTGEARIPRGAQVFTIGKEGAKPGVQDGGMLMVLEFRAERDVRQVTLVIPDERSREVTRRRMLAHDEALRGRVNELLQQAV